MIMSVSAFEPAAIGCDIESIFSAARDSLKFNLISQFGRQQNLIRLLNTDYYANGIVAFVVATQMRNENAN